MAAQEKFTLNIEIVENPGDIRNCNFSFKCPKFWAELQVTDDPPIRRCNECNEFVYRCTTDKEISLAIKHNRCVAIMPIYDTGTKFDTYFVGRIEGR